MTKNFLDSVQGFTRVRADRQMRRRYLLVTLMLGTFVLSVVIFTIWFAVGVTNRLFATVEPDRSRIATFNLTEAAQIPGLEFLAETPLPSPTPPHPGATPPPSPPMSPSP
jgi:hypothetical protein